MTTTTTDLEHTFTSADNILGDTQYACYVAADFGGGVGPRSNPAIITVVGGVAEENVTVNVEDIEFTVTYYDFSLLHPDFTYLPSTAMTYLDPTYIPSPYGAWLAFDSDPSDDTTSDWFRDVSDSGTNIVVEDTLILRGKI